MDDTISRAAALDALDKRFDAVPMELTTEILQLRRDLRDLPSAHPTGTNTVQVDDCISRQAAIENSFEVYTKEYGLCDVVSVDVINELPSAQRWIPCKTALTEHDGEYLVTKKSFGWNCTEYIETDIARYEKKNGWNKADTVLAWRELPKPWEGGQDGTD